RLRLVAPDALRHDPVRVLRAARLMTHLDLAPDAATVVAARAVAAQVAAQPPERLTAELYAMLSRTGGTRAMRSLDALGALTILVPPLIPCLGLTQGRLHHWDVFDHTLEVIDSLDRVVDLLEAHLHGTDDATAELAEGRVAHPLALDVGGQNVAVLARLQEPLAEGQTRLTMLKVAALFHDVGKPITRGLRPNGDVHFQGHAEAGVPLTTPVLEAWKVGRNARRYIEWVVACHMRPGQIAGPQGLTDRAARHYFRDAGDAGIDTAIFSLADHLAVYGPDPLTPFWHHHYAAVAELLRRVYVEPHRVIPARLIDGNDLLARYGVGPGPEVGRILGVVEAAHLNDEIGTRAEALNLVERLLAQG
nr:HD domain-containing protein [Ktedonobacterales bacterium]